jgi:cytochrome c-type biogenesis protein CcmE
MGRKLLFGILVAGTSALLLVFGWSEPKLVHARSVSAFVAHPVRDRPVRLDGALVKGSLCKISEPCEYRFRMVDRFQPGPPAELSVRYPGCIVPDTFRDLPWLDVQVSVTGKLCATCHDFEASQIMARCPGKYEMDLDGGAHRTPPVPPCGS